MRHVLFRLGDKRFALPLAVIREVVLPPSEWTRVPKAPPFVEGVFNLRGRVVLGVGLGGLLRHDVTHSSQQRLLILERGKRDVGFLVDGVEGIETFAATDSAQGVQMKVQQRHGGEIQLLEIEKLEEMLSHAFVM